VGKSIHSPLKVVLTGKILEGILVEVCNFDSNDEISF